MQKRIGFACAVAAVTSCGSSPEVVAEYGASVIAYVRLDGSEAEIWRISSDGTDQRRIGLGSEPAWSPDGKRLAFTLERGGNVDIYVMAVDGSDILRLTTDPGEDHGATWSPDGSMIAFNSTRSGSDQVWRTNVDAGGWGHNLTQLTQDTNHNRVNNFVAWSPDGRWIAFESDRDRDDPEIYLANAVDGTNQQRLTFTRALDEVPSWSPDGKVILFSSDMHDEPQSGTYDIYVMGVDGSEIRRLTSTTGSASYPSMSAVGKTIAYSYRPDRTSPPELWLMDVDGKNSRLLIRGGDMPKFSPIQVVE